MKTVYVKCFLSLCLFFSVCRHLSFSEESTKTLAGIQDDAQTKAEVKKQVIELLKSKNMEDNKKGLIILGQNPGVYLDEKNQILDTDILDALISFYQTLAFPKDFQLTYKTSKTLTEQFPQIAVFFVITQCGGDAGQEILNDALAGGDPIMREIAEAHSRGMKQEKERQEADKRAKTITIADWSFIDDTTNIVPGIKNVFSAGTFADKKQMLEMIDQRKETLRQNENLSTRDAVFSALAAGFPVEQNLYIQGLIVDAMADLEPTNTYFFLEGVRTNTSISFLINHLARDHQELLLGERKVDEKLTGGKHP